MKMSTYRWNGARTRVAEAGNLKLATKRGESQSGNSVTVTRRVTGTLFEVWLASS